MKACSFRGLLDRRQSAGYDLKRHGWPLQYRSERGSSRGEHSLSMLPQV